VKAALGVSGVLLAALMLSGCDNNGGGGPAPSSSDVAAIPATSSEASEPFPINDGAFAVNDTSETSDPRSINR
jgi:hypothetical protein